MNAEEEDNWKLDTPPGKNESCFRCDKENATEETNNGRFLCEECFEKTCEECDKEDSMGDSLCHACELEGQIMAAEFIHDQIKDGDLRLNPTKNKGD